MGVVGKGFQKGKPEEGEALLTVVPFVKEAAIMKRSIGVAFSHEAERPTSSQRRFAVESFDKAVLSKSRLIESRIRS